jgi:beta-glucosidase
VNGISKYDEKLNAGYRWYDATNTAPLFPFGFGLSYTTFELSHLTVSPSRLGASSGRPGDDVRVAVDVTNTGKQIGAEVVQVYVGQPMKNGEPPRQLRGFAKVELKPAETKHVILTLDKRSFSIYDTVARRWMSPEGTYEIMVGNSSRDLPLHSVITVDAAGEP